MEDLKLGLFKRLLYAFTCLFGTKEDILAILPSKTEMVTIEKKKPVERYEEEDDDGITRASPIHKPIAYTFGLMDRFCLIKVNDKLLDGFVTILSKGNYPVVKQDLIIINLKNMIDREIFFEHTNGYGKISSFSETEVIVTMSDGESTQASKETFNFKTFKYEPEIIQVQEKDIGIQRLRKGSTYIDFVGVNMMVIKESYLRWTKEWPLISSMVKKK